MNPAFKANVVLSVYHQNLWVMASMDACNTNKAVATHLFYRCTQKFIIASRSRRVSLIVITGCLSVCLSVCMYVCLSVSTNGGRCSKVKAGQWVMPHPTRRTIRDRIC